MTREREQGCGTFGCELHNLLALNCLTRWQLGVGRFDGASVQFCLCWVGLRACSLPGECWAQLSDGSKPVQGVVGVWLPSVPSEYEQRARMQPHAPGE